MVGYTQNFIQCFEIKPLLNRNRFLSDLRRSSNSLNSDWGPILMNLSQVVELQKSQYMVEQSLDLA